MDTRFIHYRTPMYRDGQFSHFFLWGQIDIHNQFSEECFIAPQRYSHFEMKPAEAYIYTIKGGVRIYEHDLVLVQTRKLMPGGYIDQVVWDGLQGYKLKNYKGNMPVEKSFRSIIEKAGNIHQNPDLIPYTKKQ